MERDIDINIFDEYDIKATMIGATLLASGGGGSYSDGLTLLDNFKRNHPEKDIKVKVLNVGEMQTNAHALVIAGIGAPSGQSDQDFSPCVESCFNEFKQFICPRVGKSVQYVLPIEMGGFNTLVPILAAISNNMPIVNADGAGRAVPTLTTALMNVAGIPTAPVALTDANDNRISMMVENPSGEKMIENISRVISEEFNANAAIGGWMMNKIQAMNIALGTVYEAKNIGNIILSVINEHEGEENIGDHVVKALQGASVKFSVLCERGKITQFSSDESGGFDIGSYKVTEKTNAENSYRIVFKNESLLLYQIIQDGEEKIALTAPDIITMLDRKTGLPLTNEDLLQIYQKGELDTVEIVLILMPVNMKWKRHSEKVSSVWKEQFADLGYDGDIVWI